MEVLWYQVSHTDLIQQKESIAHFGNKLMGEIPMLWELPVSREAVKSKYNKLLRSLTATHGS
jgi:hypothetical protein